MDATARASLWAQFGATIDMLENAMRACPDELWGNRAQKPEFWRLTYHTLFFLDLYLGDSGEGFTPPAPFNLEELDPAGVRPSRVYTKRELVEYLDHCRAKARARIEALDGETSERRCQFGWIDLTVFESLLYNMRHVQHHAAQLNLLLRHANHPVPSWVARSS